MYHKLFVTKNVWHLGYMHQFLFFLITRIKHHYYLHREESDYNNISQIPTETKERILLGNMLTILLSLILILLITFTFNMGFHQTSNLLASTVS